jgi:putative oxidoreductase
MALFHGWPKISGGEERWLWLGSQMKYLGLDFWPIFWGFCASLVEFAGAILLVLGIFTKWNALLLSFVMIVAAQYHMQTSGDIGDASHAMELLAVFLAIFALGPGKYSVDNYFNR